MDIEQSSAGKVLQSPKGYKAFLPYPLPPNIEWNNRLVAALSRADFLLGKLAREGSRLPNPHLLIRPFITREAVLSSKIEGTQATIGEILAANAGMKVQQNPDDLKEVQNYILALEYGLKRLEELPLSLRLIKELHEHLMQGVRGFHATPESLEEVKTGLGPLGALLTLPNLFHRRLNI